MDVFVEISMIIVLATIIAGVMRLLRQPLIIGYILTGIIVSPLFLDIMQSKETMQMFSQIGIALLLFIVGLSLSPRVIKEVGRVSIITGLGQVLFTSLFGYLLGRWLGFSIIEASYIAVALTFSSTIIIMKLLSDKNNVDTLYGKIAIGFLLVQDIIVVLLLMTISSFSKGVAIHNIVLHTIVLGVLLVALVAFLTIAILPKLSQFFARSQEFLFLFSIGWGLGVASLFHFFEFSIEMGALVAGIALSTTPYQQEISSKMRPLRDFFIILFFILLGSQMLFTDVTHLMGPALVLSFFILIGNPLIVIILMGMLGYKKKVGFMAGLTVAQISEFSLILVMLGVKLGHVTQEILSLVTIVGLITIAGSTYLILYAEKVYPYVAKYLTVFEQKILRRESKAVGRSYEALLFGCDRTGFTFVNAFRRLKKRFLVVDYNPEVIRHLKTQKVPCVYGDVDDLEFLQELKLKQAKIVVSTIPDFQKNVLLLGQLRRVNNKAIAVILTNNDEEAMHLYENGATYVVMSHFLGGKYASKMIDKYRLNKQKFLQEKEKHLKHLKWLEE